MTDAVVLAALRMAINARAPQPRLLRHTDRGGQHVSKEYKLILQRAGIRPSRSRADNCYDNAFAETCIGIIDNVNAVQAVQSRVVMRELVESILRRSDRPSYLRFGGTKRARIQASAFMLESI